MRSREAKDITKDLHVGLPFDFLLTTWEYAAGEIGTFRLAVVEGTPGEPRSEHRAQMDDTAERSPSTTPKRRVPPFWKGVIVGVVIVSIVLVGLGLSRWEPKPPDDSPTPTPPPTTTQAPTTPPPTTPMPTLPPSSFQASVSDGLGDWISEYGTPVDGQNLTDIVQASAGILGEALVVEMLVAGNIPVEPELDRLMYFVSIDIDRDPLTGSTRMPIIYNALGIDYEIAAHYWRGQAWHFTVWEYESNTEYDAWNCTGVDEVAGSLVRMTIPLSEIDFPTSFDFVCGAWEYVIGEISTFDHAPDSGKLTIEG